MNENKRSLLTIPKETEALIQEARRKIILPESRAKACISKNAWILEAIETKLKCK